MREKKNDYIKRNNGLWMGDKKGMGRQEKGRKGEMGLLRKMKSKIF